MVGKTLRMRVLGLTAAGSGSASGFMSLGLDFQFCFYALCMAVMPLLAQG